MLPWRRRGGLLRGRVSLRASGAIMEVDVKIVLSIPWRLPLLSSARILLAELPDLPRVHLSGH